MPPLSLLGIVRIKTEIAGHRQWLKTLHTSKRVAQISSVRLASGHRNSLKLLQSVNLHSARNSLIQLNYREMRELANPLNRLDYNDSLELDSGC